MECGGTVICLALFAFLASLILSFRRRGNIFSAGAPANRCPANLPVLGNAVAFTANRHRFLDWASDLLNSAHVRTIEVRFPLNILRGVCTADPIVVDHILRCKFKNYVKGSRYSLLSDLLGRGIFRVDESFWAFQRKTASREFTTRSLKSFVAHVVADETRRRLLPKLVTASESGEVIDLQDLLQRFAFDTICRVAFGTDPNTLREDGKEQEETFFYAFDEAVRISSERLFNPLPWVWKAKRALNVGSERRLRRAIQVIDEYAMKIISGREEEDEEEEEEEGLEKRDDLLSRFIGVVKEDPNSFFKGRGDSERRRFLRDIVISFILAGKDTSSSGLTWFFWLLSSNPRCERRVLRELLDEQIKNDDGVENDHEMGYYEELKGLHYLHAAISESLRLYPPVPIISRLAVEDDVLPDGTTVKAGWFADYCAYAMARSEAVWGERCREYVPERWLDDRGLSFVPVEPAKFPVFHAGPRTCLGRDMAYLQMKAIAAAVLKEFHIEPVASCRRTTTTSSDPPEYHLSITLRMKGGFPVRLERRK